MLIHLYEHFVSIFLSEGQSRDSEMSGFDEDTTITLGFALGAVALIVFIAVWVAFYFLCCRYVCQYSIYYQEVIKNQAWVYSSIVEVLATSGVSVFVWCVIYFLNQVIPWLSS